MIYEPIPLKRCSKNESCLHPEGPILPAQTTYFHKNSRNKDGLDYYCKKCRLEIKCKWERDNPDKKSVQTKRNYVKYAEHYRALAREYRSSHYDEIHQKIKTAHEIQRRNELSRKRYKESPEHFREAARHWRKNNPEKIRNWMKRWQVENPEKVKIHRMRRRARRIKLTANFTLFQWEKALTYFHERCAACGRPQGLWHKLVADHWIPIADPRPGNPGTVATNIVPLCHGVGGCNNSKGDKDPVIWLIEKFGKRKAKQILAKIEAYFAWVKEQDE